MSMFTLASWTAIYDFFLLMQISLFTPASCQDSSGTSLRRLEFITTRSKLVDGGTGDREEEKEGDDRHKVPS